MGLFERIRSVFGANGADDHQNGQTSAAGRDGPVVQSHGSHWDTLVPDSGREAAIQELMMETVSDGEVLDAESRGDDAVTGHRLQDGSLGTLAVTVDDEVVTSYPIAKGVDHNIEAEALKEWESGIEAWLGSSLDDAGITTFVSNYFQHPNTHFGGKCQASLAMLMYDFGMSDYDTVVDEDGEELDVSDFAGFRPLEQGAPDDYVVRTTVKSVDTVSHAGFDAYRIEAPLFRTEAGEDVDAAFYAGTHLVEDEPTPGDSVEGAGWMQTWIH